jgi:hypothetical protein
MLFGLLAVLAAPAAQAAQGFSLGLPEAADFVSFEGTTAPAPRIVKTSTGEVSATETGGLESSIAALRARSLQEPSLQTTQSGAAGTSEKGGFGRWLKKHWYVPVIVGVAIGVAVSSSGGDSDATGEDD